MAYETGPFVQVACFCEMVLREASGVASLIRIVDTITHEARGPEPPEEMQPLTHTLNLALMLKSGTALGRSDVKIVPMNPDKSSDNPQIISVHFEGEEKGANIIINFRKTFNHEGVYWFDVFIDEVKITSLPLRVKYNRVVIGTTPTGK